MKKISLIILLYINTLYATVYYAKLEPYITYNVKASVNGTVIFTNKDLEAKYIKNNIVCKIDNKTDKIDLKQTKQKLTLLEDILSIEKSTLLNLQKIRSKSQIEKDNQKIKILNLKANISDLKTKLALLNDKITKKTISIKNRYLYKLAVEKGDYLNPGSLIYTAYDISKGKLTIFIPIDEAKNIKNKTIYIDDKKTNLKISKLYKIADTQHISSYRCEIYIKNPKQFSKLVKVEFK